MEHCPRTNLARRAVYSKAVRCKLHVRHVYCVDRSQEAINNPTDIYVHTLVWPSETRAHVTRPAVAISLREPAQDNIAVHTLQQLAESWPNHTLGVMV